MKQSKNCVCNIYLPSGTASCSTYLDDVWQSTLSRCQYGILYSFKEEGVTRLPPPQKVPMPNVADKQIRTTVKCRFASTSSCALQYPVIKGGHLQKCINLANSKAGRFQNDTCLLHIIHPHIAG